MSELSQSIQGVLAEIEGDFTVILAHCNACKHFWPYACFGSIEDKVLECPKCGNENRNWLSEESD